MSIWKNFIAVVLWIVVLVAISCCIFFFEVISGDIVPNGVLPVATPAPVESVVPVAIVKGVDTPIPVSSPEYFTTVTSLTSPIATLTPVPVVTPVPVNMPKLCLDPTNSAY